MLSALKHLLLFFIVATIFSVSLSPHSAQAEQFQLETLTISDGLPSSSITTLYQQRDGFIWFGTDTGASRYDGVNFTNFQFSESDKTHISNNYITKIHEDRSGNIWIATEDGLNQLTQDNEIIIHNMISTQSSLGSSWIIEIYEQENGLLWFGTGSGLTQYNPQNKQFTAYSLFDENQAYETSVSGVFSDHNGTIWAVTDYGLATLNTQSDQLEIVKFEGELAKQLDPVMFYGAKKAKNGEIWLGSYRNGLFKLNLETRSINNIHFNKDNPSNQQLPSNHIQSFTFKDDNTLWVTHGKGASRITLDTMSFSHLTHEAFNPNSMPSDYVPIVMVDQSGGVWFGTGNGASLYSNFKQGTRLYRPKPISSELSGNMVYWFDFDKDNNTWISTTKGIDKLRLNKDLISLQPISELTPSMIYSATIDDANTMWISQADGLTVYDIDTERLRHFSNAKDNPHGLPESEFYLALPDNHGNAWITGYLDVGLILFNPDKGILKQLLHHNDNSYAAGGNFTFDKQLLHNGELWLATTNAIYRVNPQTYEVKHLPLGSEAQNIRTAKIYQDENNTVWVASQGLGLVKIEVSDFWSDDLQLEYITKEDGLASNTLKGVTGDGQGHLWITTQSKFAKMHIETQKITKFPSAINHKDSSFSDAAIAFQKDELYIGTNNGAFKIDTRAIKSNQFSPQVHITSALIANEEYIHLNSNHSIDALTLDYEQNMVQFSFAALDFNAPQKNQYRYKLHGFDERWIYSQNISTATYTNLHAGDYRFVVQGSNSDGIWSPLIAELSFTIKKPWWYFAIISLVLVCALLTFLFLLTRYQKVTELKNRANFDTLTGLSNRFRFNTVLEATVNQKHQHAAVAFIDLDYFKEVNDSMGHDIGDELIIQVSKRLSSNLKSDDLLARLGGDEFAIILRNPGELSQLVNIIERLRLAINTGYQIQEHWIKSSASIGVACYPEDGLDAKTLLKHADTAMYAAKQAGRNSAYFFNEALSVALQEKISIKQQLQHALTNDEFELYYQPKICLKTGNIRSFEALLRWFHPDKGLIPPDKFIPEAESNGQIIEIGYWVIKQACITANQWHQEGLLKGSVSVNISPVQLSQPDISEKIEAILVETGFPAEKLELEITESLLIENVETAKKVLNQLHDLKIRLSLDDFGKGYSSLNYLTRFPLNTLKIDKGFIDSFLDNEAAKAVLKNIINLGNDLKMQIVAEGIETEMQLIKLIQYQCHTGQGYIFSPAVNTQSAYKMLTGETVLLPKFMQNKVG
ncbi:EAL domain-containing protein [Shewanella japonica]|uniref:EAL domain-containing protein n=1 Tax=Shewanella japonica TaxID=93973 RepID=UPI002493E749|nr:EAL domain-containing protein [Shewanella japonica]